MVILNMISIIDKSNNNNDYDHRNDDGTLFTRQIFRFEKSQDIIGAHDVKKKSSFAYSWNGSSSSLQKVPK